MKNFFYLLIATFLVFAYGSTIGSTSDKNIELTKEQKNFARKVSNNIGILKAEWVNTYVLDVIYEEHWYGAISKSSAKTQAGLLAAQGYLFINKNICVKILDYKLGELGYKCVGDQSES